MYNSTPPLESGLQALYLNQIPRSKGEEREILLGRNCFDKITAEELKYLVPCVKKLEVTERICKEKIEGFIQGQR
jgi:hypothetical protein